MESLSPDLKLKNKMKFCEECGAMLTVGRGVYTCLNCGSKEPIPFGSYEVKRDKPEKKVYVKRGEGDASTIKVSCPRCDNDRAYVASVATGMGVTIVVQKFTCTKCKHSWR